MLVATVNYQILNNILAAFNLLNKDGDTLSTRELSAVFGFGNQKEAAVMERFLKIAIRKELHIEGDVNMTFEEFYELIGGDRESGLQGIALAFEVTFYRAIFEFKYFSRISTKMAMEKSQ